MEPRLQSTKSNLLASELSDNSRKMTGTLCFMVDLVFHKVPGLVRTRIKSLIVILGEAVAKNFKLRETKLTIQRLTENQAMQLLTDFPPRNQNSLNRNELNIDIDRGIWIPGNVLGSMLITASQWVSIQIIDGDSNPTSRIFPCIVYIDKDNYQTHPSIKVTDTLYHNLKKHFGLAPTDFSSSGDDDELRCRLIPLLTNSIIKSLDKFAFDPLRAKTVKLSRLTSCYEHSEEECDMLIKAFFQNLKHLALGDVVSIPQGYSGRSLELIVNQIDDESSTITQFGAVYLVSSESSSLYLTTAVNAYHVGISDEDVLVPNVLRPYLNEMQDLFTQAIKLHLGPPSYDNDLWPTILVHGSIGSGKMCVCTATALKLGLNFYFVNAVNLIGDTSAYTEAKLKSLGERVKSLLPCLIYIKNVHVCHLL